MLRFVFYWCFRVNEHISTCFVMANSSNKISSGEENVARCIGDLYMKRKRNQLQRKFSASEHCTKSQDSSNKLFSQSLLYSREMDSELFKRVECNLLIADSDRKKKI